MVKKLKKSIRQYRISSIKTILYVALEVVLEVVIPLLMANLIDYGIDEGNMPYILKLGIALLISAFFALVFGVLAGKHAAIASSGFAANLRQDMFYKVQGFTFHSIDKFSTASIVTRLTTDVTNLQMAYQMIIRMAMRSPLMLLFSLVAAFRIDGDLSLIFISVLPVLAVGLFLIMTKAHPIFEKIFKTYDKLNNVVQENLRGIRVVKAFVQEKREIEKFEHISGQIFRDFTKAEKILTVSMPLMQFCMYACMLLISWFGARAIVACGNDPVQGLSTGELMSLMTYIMQILMSLMMLAMVFVMITMARASAERIEEVLDEESDMPIKEHPVTDVKDGSVEFSGVTFYYGKNKEKPALNQIDFTIKSGETVGIIGSTGSSKSTLVQLIPRLYDVSSGCVKVGDVDVRDYDLEVLRNAVAVVLQKNELFSGTIAENLRWGNEQATEEELIHVCQLAQAHDFISAFPDGYETYIEQGGTNVSGGQKQRLCIARALLKKPKILILDDSTSAVDTRTDAMIRKAFKEELPGTTKIIIAQRISSVEDADKIIVMDDGKINGTGNHKTLMETNEIYREVYFSQKKGGSENE